MAIKYIELLNALHTDIRMGVYRDTGRLPTEMQLASMYGVSRQTVRRALGILVEEGLIERRQGSGSKLLDANAVWAGNNVAVIATFMDDYIFPTLLHHVQSVLEQHSFSTLVYATQNKLNREREILQGLIDNPVRGVLVEGVKSALPNPNLDLYRQIQRMGIPVVFFHSSYPELDAVCIADDNVGGAYQAVEHLLQKGHKNIGGIFKGDECQGLERCAGLFAAMRDHGLPYPEERIQWYTTEMRAGMMDEGRSPCIKRFLTHEGKDCTAVLCHNDEVARSLIQVMETLGLRCPEDVAVCSFDNTYYSEMGPTPITSLAHENGSIGRISAQALVSLIQGQEAQSQRVEWELIPKKST
jgi:GntR family transcriptional regulator of arabinose operon